VVRFVWPLRISGEPLARDTARNRGKEIAEASMNCSIRYALVLSFLVLAPEAKPGMAPSPPPRTPTGVYAVVELATVVSPDSTSVVSYK
jgi:hypothetical protein